MVAFKGNPVDPILERALSAAGRINAPLREKLVALAGRRLPPAAFLSEAQRLILATEPRVAAVLTPALIAAYLAPAVPLAKAVPLIRTVQPAGEREIPSILPDPLPEPFGPDVLMRPPTQPPRPPLALPGPAPEEPPPIRFPLIERAARSLYRRQVFTRGDFDDLDNEAKRLAFTVSRVNSIATMDKLQDFLTESAAKGTTLRTFQQQAATVLAETPLTPAHLENVYRTNLATAYSIGQRELLEHPLISDEFPYVLWTATHDVRTRADHLAMEKAGLNGTAVFRRDDPLLQSVWPPAGFNCRCHVIPLTLEDAAALGVREAIEWLRTGEPPTQPAWVKSVPIKLPAGWVGATAA